MDVINLVSSDEEQDGEKSLKRKSLKSSKNLTIKKIGPIKAQQNVNKIPMEKISMPTAVQKNNNNVTVIRVPKQKSHAQAQQLSHVTSKTIPTVMTDLNVHNKQQQQQPQPQQKQQQPVQKTVKISPSITITAVNSDGVANNRPSSIIDSKNNAVTITQRTVPQIQPTLKSFGVSKPNAAQPAIKIKSTTISPIIVNATTPNKSDSFKPASAKPTTFNSSTKSTAPVNRTVQFGRIGPNSATAKPTKLASISPIIVNTAMAKDPLAIASRTDPPALSPPIIVTRITHNSNHCRPAKRIIPTKISDAITMRAGSMEKSSDSDVLSRDSSSVANDETTTSAVNGTNQSESGQQPPAKRPKLADQEKTPMNSTYLQLIEACRKVDPGDDMKKITAKLEKYYHRAHPDYVNSKCFRKMVTNVTAEINAQPKLVYMKLNPLLEELKTRRIAPDSTNDVEQTTTAPAQETSEEEAKRKKIERLSDVLRVVQKRIRKFERAEVDWDDETSSNYLITERYKKRACEIYEKLCDLTGESRSAERIVKKPIKFMGTSYPEFNRKLEKFINETKSFPDMFDVLRIMDHCNKHYDYRLSKEQRKTVAQDAFHQVGTQLQKRRKADLYEMVQYFTANEGDPAGEDPVLKMKLEENQKLYNKRMKEVIEKFSMRHDHNETSEEQSPVKNAPKTTSNSTTVPTTSSAHSTAQPTIAQAELKIDVDAVAHGGGRSGRGVDGGIDMLDECVFNDEFNDPGAFNDANEFHDALLDAEEMQVLSNEFLPTITSVTSLHPSKFNELFESSQIESSNIL